MLVQLGSSEAQASFTLFSVCPSPPIITTVRRLQGTFVCWVQSSPLQRRSIWINSGLTLSAANLVQANGAWGQLWCPLPSQPCPNTTTTAGPITESPDLPNWIEAMVWPCKSKLKGSLQEHRPAIIGEIPQALLWPL